MGEYKFDVKSWLKENGVLGMWELSVMVLITGVLYYAVSTFYAFFVLLCW